MKFIICYYEHNPKMADRLYMELVTELGRHGIDILRMSTALMVIDTPHTYIQFVTDPIKMRGRRPDEVFSCDDINPILDYILKEENG